MKFLLDCNKDRPMNEIAKSGDDGVFVSQNERTLLWLKGNSVVCIYNETGTFHVFARESLHHFSGDYLYKAVPKGTTITITV